MRSRTPPQTSILAEAADDEEARRRTGRRRRRSRPARRGEPVTRSRAPGIIEFIISSAPRPSTRDGEGGDVDLGEHGAHLAAGLLALLQGRGEVAQRGDDGAARAVGEDQRGDQHDQFAGGQPFGELAQRVVDGAADGQLVGDHGEFLAGRARPAPRRPCRARCAARARPGWRWRGSGTSSGSWLMNFSVRRCRCQLRKALAPPEPTSRGDRAEERVRGRRRPSATARRPGPSM